MKKVAFPMVQLGAFRKVETPILNWLYSNVPCIKDKGNASLSVAHTSRFPKFAEALVPVKCTKM